MNKYVDTFLVLTFFLFLVLISTEVLFRLVVRIKRGKPYKPVEKLKYNRSHHIPHPYLPSAASIHHIAPSGIVDLPLNSEGLYYKPIMANGYGYYFNEELLGKRNLIVFMGNCTFGTGYYRGESYYRLPDYMNRIVGTDYSFLTIGMGGWTSMNIIFHLYTNVLEFKPKAIVFGFGLNDIVPCLAPGFKPDYSHHFRNLGEAKMHRLIRDVLPKIRFWHLYEFLLSLYFGKGNIRYDLLRFIRKSKPDFNSSFNGLRVEKRNIKSMIGICKQHDIFVILTTYLYYLYDEVKNKPTYQKFKEGVDIENSNIRQIANECNTYLIDIEKDFPYERECFLDTTHLSPVGIKKYAEIFIPQFNECIKLNKF